MKPLGVGVCGSSGALAGGGAGNLPSVRPKAAGILWNAPSALELSCADDQGRWPLNLVVGRWHGPLARNRHIPFTGLALNAGLAQNVRHAAIIEPCCCPRDFQHKRPERRARPGHPAETPYLLGHGGTQRRLRMLPGRWHGRSRAFGRPPVAHAHHCGLGGEVENLNVEMAQDLIARSVGVCLAARLRLFLGRPDGPGQPLRLH